MAKADFPPVKEKIKTFFICMFTLLEAGQKNSAFYLKNMDKSVNALVKRTKYGIINL